MVAAKGQLDPQSWERTADYILATAEKTSKGEKVASYRVTNCETDDPAAATVLIKATQAMNTRSTKDKTYHLVFSFPPGENPSIDVLHAIEDELVKSIGFADHQRISAVHIDTDHLHVHVAINKVHPTGFQNIEPYYDKKRLMETCERLEVQYGLQRTNHGLEAESGATKARSGKAADAEAHAGIETLSGYVAREAAPAIRHATSWQQVHDTLAEHGLEIKKRGAGLVIGDPKSSLWAKASNCGRDLSLKALTDRLGPFQASESTKEKGTKHFDPQPRQQPSASVEPRTQKEPAWRELWNRYQADRPAITENRQQAWKRQLDNERKRRANIKAVYLAARSNLKRDDLKPAERKAGLSVARMERIAAEAALRQEITQEREALKVAYPAGSEQYSLWLRQQAQNGDSVALDELRKRERYKPGVTADLMPAAGELRSEAPAQPTPFLPFKYEINRRGDVTYADHRGRLLSDQSDRVSMLRSDEQAVAIGLKLASQKFYKGGDFTELDVGGSDQFKRQAVEIAVRDSLRVKFTDQGMESLRQQLLKEKQQAREHEKQKKPKAQPQQQKATKEAEKQRIVERERTKANARKKDRGGIGD
ncbi:conjugal transfer protein TraI [Klebsiella pneumoniae]|nr:conjugal transfer protein TraI [Klebsiella pneumoniae]